MVWWALNGDSPYKAEVDAKRAVYSWAINADEHAVCNGCPGRAAGSTVKTCLGIQMKKLNSKATSRSWISDYVPMYQYKICRYYCGSGSISHLPVTSNMLYGGTRDGQDCKKAYIYNKRALFVCSYYCLASLQSVPLTLLGPIPRSLLNTWDISALVGSDIFYHFHISAH